MTLDEAIKHAEEVTNANERMCKTVHPAMQVYDYAKYAEEHRQLAEWLNDYKRLLEQEPCEDAISRQAVMDCFKKWQPYMATRLWDFEQELSALPPITPQPKKGNWIEVIDEIDSLGNKTWHHKCSICGNEDSGWGVYKYCHNCGADMRGEDKE